MNSSKFTFHFIIFVQLQLSPFSPHYSPLPYPLPHLPHSILPLHCLCPWVLHTCSLTWPFPFFPLLFPSLLPSGHCQFILYFHVSGSILFTCLFCWLGSTYQWDHKDINLFPFGLDLHTFILLVTLLVTCSFPFSFKHIFSSPGIRKSTLVVEVLHCSWLLKKWEAVFFLVRETDNKVH